MNGRVVEIDYIGGYGLFIRLEHDVNGGKWETVYAHLQNTSVPENIYIGKEVEIGEVIGKVGRTGLATGPHLHFEVRINGKKVNPLPLLYKNTSSI
jgi:murein DD-endopeptidase MepM/ murein hydrolase activator NlpD